jgi:parallel beta-helix repeat protein
MHRRTLVLLLSALSVMGCGRIGYDGPYDQVLTVDVLEDRMEAPATVERPSDVGAVGLSLREAITIANNTPGSELVEFDPSIFPPGTRTNIDLGTALDLGGGATRIDCGTRAGFRSSPLVLDGVSDVVVTGCRFDVSSGHAIQVIDSTDVHIHDNAFFDSGESAIRVETVDGECKDVRIENNRIEHAGSDLVGIYDCEEVLIADNMMIVGDKGAQRGVHFERVLSSQIVDNIIDPGEARMINFQDASHNLIQGNVLEGAHAGVVLYGASNDNVIIQNVAMDMVYDGVYVSSEAQGNTVVHNTFFQCSTAIADGAADTVLGNNLDSSDPADFVDPTPGVYDFTLVAGSAHVDAGEDLGYDCLPNAPERFLGEAPDLGAVESY